MSIERQRAIALVLWVCWALISVVAIFGWGLLWNLGVNGLYGPRNLIILQLFGLFVTIPVIFSLLSGNRTAPNIFIGVSGGVMFVLILLEHPEIDLRVSSNFLELTGLFGLLFWLTGWMRAKIKWRLMRPLRWPFPSDVGHWLALVYLLFAVVYFCHVEWFMANADWPMRAIVLILYASALSNILFRDRWSLVLVAIAWGAWLYINPSIPDHIKPSPSSVTYDAILTALVLVLLAYGAGYFRQKIKWRLRLH